MFKVSLIVVSLFFTSVAARADGIPIEPGLWEMTSKIQMPMLPEPRVNTDTQCMEKSVISMDDIQRDGMDPNCTFETTQVDEKTMQWSFDCPVEGGTSHGEWEATSHGDSVEGGGKITMTMQGQEMEMTMEWVGKRVGACP